MKRYRIPGTYAGPMFTTFKIDEDAAKSMTKSLLQSLRAPRQIRPAGGRRRTTNRMKRYAKRSR